MTGDNPKGVLSAWEQDLASTIVRLNINHMELGLHPDHLNRIDRYLMDVQSDLGAWLQICFQQQDEIADA